MAKVVGMRGVTGIEGDQVGRGVVQTKRLVWAGSMEDAEIKTYTATNAPIIAEGRYCQIGQRPEETGPGAPTPERRAKGDLIWGSWTIIENVRLGHDGVLKGDKTTVRAWHRADRIASLLRQGVIDSGMGKAARKLAATAEEAGTVGLRSTFGSVKVDGGSASRDRRITGGGMAAMVIEEAMTLLGSTNGLMGGVVWLVVVEGLSLRQIEGCTTWTKRKLDRNRATGALQAGLDRLARHWGMQDADAA